MAAESFAEVVDLIFGKLAVRYGAAWLRQWDGVDMALVKADWRSELSGFAGNLEPLRYALRHLPERCPGVGELKALANCCPPPVLPVLEAPKADPALVREVMEQAKQVTAKPLEHDPKAWAYSLKARHESGERLGQYQIDCYQRALGIKSRMKAGAA